MSDAAVRSKRKPTLSPAARKRRLATRKPVAGLGTAAVNALSESRGPIENPRPPARRKRADQTEDPFAILGELVRAISLIETAKRSLEARERHWDEITTLEAGIKMLRRCDVALNNVADGRPSGIRPDEDEDTTDDVEGDV